MTHTKLRKDCALVWKVINEKTYKGRVWIPISSGKHYFNEFQGSSIEEIFFKINLLLKSFNYEDNIMNFEYEDVTIEDVIN